MSGTAHVLAVSDCMLGLFILFLMYSFLFMVREKMLFQTAADHSFSLRYAFLTGLSVSVVRAAIMLRFLFAELFTGKDFLITVLQPQRFYSCFNPLSFSKQVFK